MSIFFAACRIKSTAQSKFELPKTSIFRPRCSVNQFIWYRPRQDHIVTFHQSRQSFTLCLSRVGEGMSIYQLRGTSRKLLAGSNATGELGCFESECKHLTLYFDVESSLKVSRISYTYRSKIVNSESLYNLWLVYIPTPSVQHFYVCIKKHHSYCKRTFTMKKPIPCC